MVQGQIFLHVERETKRSWPLLSVRHNWIDAPSLSGCGESSRVDVGVIGTSLGVHRPDGFPSIGRGDDDLAKGAVPEMLQSVSSGADRPSCDCGPNGQR